MSEFTGERVIPGLVDDDLLNEHLARYRFAALHKAERVLDAGCGSGYGTAVFPAPASVTAMDIAADALQLARESFARPGVRFVQGSCEAIPFADGSFDLVTAFEVIEHLERWPRLLTEAARVLEPAGVLLVSTPNKAYYAETRSSAGPNPFHCHEFEFEEFAGALRAVFPHVRIWTQNHSEAIVFAPANQTAVKTILDAGGNASPETAHFFLAACSHTEITGNDVYAWVPSSANVLREREHHIAKLEGECAKKDNWLHELATDHSSLQASHEGTLTELRQRNQWAERLNEEVADRRATIVQLQQEAAASLTWVEALQAQLALTDTEVLRLQETSAALEADLAARTAWARTLEAQLAERTSHMLAQADELTAQTAHLERQAELLAQQATRLGRLRAERRLIAGSKWVRLGRKLGAGPAVQAGEE